MSAVPRILYVEDNENDFVLLKYALTQAGVQAELLFASNARSAVDLLAKVPDVAMVLLDLHLPDLPGLEVLDWIRREKPAFVAPVLLLTGNPALVDEARTADLRVFRLETKPRHLSGYVRLARGLGRWLTASAPSHDTPAGEPDTVSAT